VGRAGLSGAFPSGAGRLFGGVQNSDLKPEIGHVGGDAAAHGSRSDDTDMSASIPHVTREVTALLSFLGVADSRMEPNDAYHFLQ